MAGNRISIMNIKDLIRLKLKGKSNRRIAHELGVSRNTVNEYVSFFDHQDVELAGLLSWSDKDLLELFTPKTEVHMDRFAELAQYFDYFAGELKKLGATKEQLWKQYRAKHADGYGLSQFNYHLNTWLKRVNGSTKLEHKFGDKLYIDFCGKKLHYVDKSSGELIAVEVFVAILPASQYTFACGLHSQSSPDLIQGLNACLFYMGGVPLAIVPDNMKTAVTHSHRYAPKLNRTLLDFARHYGCVISPTRAYSPQDKALVENAVNLVYKRIFYPLSSMTFFDLNSLNAQIRQLLDTYNDQLFSRRNTTRRQEFLALEQAQLNPLPNSPYLVRTFKELMVQKMGYVYVSEDKHYYSVPHRLIGRRVTVCYSSSEVEVFYQSQRVAFHRRDYTRGGYSTQKQHLSSQAKAYSDWSLPYFQDKATQIGPHTCSYITELIEHKSYPELGYKQAQGILMLEKLYAKERIESACQQAGKFTKRGYHIIANMLKNNTDRADPFEQRQHPFTELTHANVRGPDYYQ